MHKTLIILAIFVAISCSNNNKNGATDIAYQSLDTTINFSGYWLNENYLESIRKYKSPKKAQFNSKYLIIPIKTLRPTQMITNFNSFGSFLAVLKHNDNYELWGIKYGEITEFVDSIVFLNKTKVKIGNTIFEHVNLISDGVKVYILEELLFKGNYSDQNHKNIIFKNNGEIEGFGNYKYYNSYTDNSESGMEVDQIGLSSTNKDVEKFGFKFNRNILEIYSLKCLSFDSLENRCVKVENGDLMYQLECR